MHRPGPGAYRTWQTGSFTVPKGTAGLVLARAIADAKHKFQAHLNKLGVYVHHMIVKKVQDWTPDYMPVQLAKNNMVVYVPTSTGMRMDHPLYEPDKDRYTIQAYTSRPPIEHVIDVGDDFIRRHGVPKGWRMTD